MVEPTGSSICACCGKVQAQPTLECAECHLLLKKPLRFVRAAARYTGPLRQGIQGLKYAKRTELAPLLARYLVAEFAQSAWRAVHATLDGVVAVPLHRERLSERGYNQAELLASAFCQQAHLPLYADWIERQRSTRSQVGLDAWERQENVDDAFLASHQVENKVLLLIDDVYTTGATLRACASAALAAGAQAVYGLALAAPVRAEWHVV
ncbi:MAG: hypothetical protein U0350_07020 [Caldilineaceae bacterium]